jgi:RHS repeat-associated protein
MEAGERWMLNDVAGKPIRAWDSRGHSFRTEYDTLRRPLNAYVTGADPQDAEKKILFGKTDYGENQDNDTALNLRTRVFKQYDGAGIVTNIEYDFKGNLLRSTRVLAHEYREIVNWSNEVQTDETFTSSTTYDALNRPIQIIAPHRTLGKLNVIQPVYNEANFLEREDVWLEQDTEPSGLLDPATAPQQPVKNNDHVTYFNPVKNIDYNAKGQRVLIEYGNGVRTQYEYDPQTFRLIHLFTTRGTSFPDDCENPTKCDDPPIDCPKSGNFSCGLQNICYTYDPAGNIIVIRDNAQQKIYFNGEVVRPDSNYTYDAVYRLIQAHGREHPGQAAQSETTWNDEFRTAQEHPYDGTKMRNYFESYTYDEVGNILIFDHKADSGNWTRAYEYDENSLIKTETGKNNNRLSRTVLHPDGLKILEPYTYDLHGNMTSMPHLEEMEWDYKDQLHHVVKGTENAYYVYDASGQRVHKVVEKNNGNLIEERIYIGGFEIFRTENANCDISLERETLHIMDDKQRIALVDTRTEGEDESPRQAVRYQFGNHLGSASLELDENAQVISYEEYYPYGSTSYQAGPNTVEVKRKRYRYTGKERDEETGLYYHGARYYAPWVGRWVSCDPAGMVDNINFYVYAKSNPIIYVDFKGNQSRMMQAAVAPFKELESSVSNIWTEFKEASANLVNEIKRDLGLVPPSDVSPTTPLPKPSPVEAEVPKNFEWQPQTKEEAYKAMENAPNIRVLGGEIKVWESRELQESRSTIKRLNAAIEGFDIAGAMLTKGTIELVKAEVGSRIMGASIRFAGEGIAGAAESTLARAPRPGAPATPAQALATDADVLAQKLSAAPGQRVFYVGPSGAGSTVAVRTYGNKISFDTQTNAGMVKRALEESGRVNPGCHIILGSGTHGGPKGDWAATNPSLAELRFFLEDVATTSPGNLPTVGPRSVMDVATPGGEADFALAEQTAANAPPGTVTCVAAWCYSTVKK